MNPRERLIAVAIVLSASACERGALPTATPGGTVPAFAVKVGSFKSFRVPTDNSQPRHITLGSDGNMWFTHSTVDDLGADVTLVSRIDAAGKITEFAAPDDDLESGVTFDPPDGIVAGPDGALWFTMPPGFPNQIGRVTTAGAFTSFGARDSEGNPTSIVPNGIASAAGHLWFTINHPSSSIVKMTTSGEMTFYPTPTAGSTPQGITLGPDGNLWFAEFHGDKIGRLDPVTATITEFGPVTGPFEITAGPDGNVWFTSPFNHSIGRITPTGDITVFPLANSPHPRDIVAGPDGNLWFTEYLAEQLARITPDGVVTEVQRMRGGPWGIGRGAGSTIWVTLIDGNKVARFALNLP